MIRLNKKSFDHLIHWTYVTYSAFNHVFFLLQKTTVLVNFKQTNKQINKQTNKETHKLKDTMYWQYTSKLNIYVKSLPTSQY